MKIKGVYLLIYLLNFFFVMIMKMCAIFYTEIYYRYVLILEIKIFAADTKIIFSFIIIYDI